MIYKEVNQKRKMTRVDKEEKTSVICPDCGKHIKTWGVNYFNCCGKRHSVPDNLDEEIEEEPEEELLSEEDLEEGETLVKCQKCGTFLITTEENVFSHCDVEQEVKTHLAKFEELSGGEDEKEDKTSKGGEESKTTAHKTRAILSNGKGSHKETTDKKTSKAEETGEEEESGESEDSDALEDTPDKEVENWQCSECGCLYCDNGYSDAKCPECDNEYAIPLGDDYE